MCIKPYQTVLNKGDLVKMGAESTGESLQRTMWCYGQLMVTVTIISLEFEQEPMKRPKKRVISRWTAYTFYQHSQNLQMIFW